MILVETTRAAEMPATVVVHRNGIRKNVTTMLGATLPRTMIGTSTGTRTVAKGTNIR